MSTFKIGDQVKVITKKYGEYQYHKVGKIHQILPRGSFALRVDFGYYNYNSYCDEDLELYCNSVPYDSNQEPEDDCL